jgi:hypothetical protein
MKFFSYRLALCLFVSHCKLFQAHTLSYVQLQNSVLLSMFLILQTLVSRDIVYSEDIWRLCWRHGTPFPLCTITTSITAFPSFSGTAPKHPHEILVRNKIEKWLYVPLFWTVNNSVSSKHCICRFYLIPKRNKGGFPKGDEMPFFEAWAKFCSPFGTSFKWKIHTA